MRRREILRLVRDGELAEGEIAAHFDVTRPAISQHLTVLKEAPSGRKVSFGLTVKNFCAGSRFSSVSCRIASP